MRGSKDLNFRGNSNSAGGTTVKGNIGSSGSNIAISNIGTSTSNTALNGTLGASVTSVTQNSATSTLTLGGVNTNYAGTTTLTQGSLIGQDAGTNNFIKAFGTGAVNLNAAPCSGRRTRPALRKRSF